MNTAYQDLIDDYLLGRMSEERRRDFERQMRQDNGLREQTEFTRAVLAATRSRNEKLARMRRWQDEDERETVAAIAARPAYPATGSGYSRCEAPQTAKPSKRRHSGKKAMYWISGIAAMLIVGLFVFKTFQERPFSVSSEQAAISKDLQLAKRTDNTPAETATPPVIPRHGTKQHEHHVVYGPTGYDESMEIVEGAEAVMPDDPADAAMPDIPAEASMTAPAAAPPPDDKLLAARKSRAEASAKEAPAKAASAKPARQSTDELLALNRFSKALAQIEAEEKQVKAEIRQTEAESALRYDSDDSAEDNLVNTTDIQKQLQQRLDQLHWQKAQALIGLSRKSEAQELLDRLRKQSGAYQSDADSLYKTLR